MDNFNVQQYNHRIKFKLGISVRKLADGKEMNRIKEDNFKEYGLHLKCN